MRKYVLGVLLILVVLLLSGCTFCYSGNTGLGADNVDANIKGKVGKAKASRECRMCLSMRANECKKCFEVGKK